MGAPERPTLMYRALEVAAEMYRSLDLQAQQAKLQEAATIPDVSILEPAFAPLAPTSNTAPVLILGAIGAALGLGIVLAILLDQTDKRFRYPEQATCVPLRRSRDRSRAKICLREYYVKSARFA